MKCYKCGINFKDRKDPEDQGINKKLCWNCRFIWQAVGATIRSLGAFPKLNRDVDIRIDDLIIRKK